MPSPLTHLFPSLAERLEDHTCRTISQSYDFFGYKRIYLIHLRKTGGTSLNHAFLRIADSNPNQLYERLVQASNHRIRRGRAIFVGWNVGLINAGHYFYGFSHTPIYELDLPDQTFTITCFRDPVKRVLSHYNMLMAYRRDRVEHPCMVTEGPWLGNCFEHFLDSIPRKHLLNQLYMYSRDLNIGEATDRIAQLSHVFFTSEYDHGVAELNKKTGLQLEPLHRRRASFSGEIQESSRVRLREMLQAEYDFLEHVRRL